MRGVLGAADVVLCSSRAEMDELAGARSAGAGCGWCSTEPSCPAAGRRRSRGGAGGARAGAGAVGAVLYIGKLEERKRRLDAVAAAELAVSRGAPVVLLVVGDGPLTAAVGDRAGAAVRPLGFRSGRDISSTAPRTCSSCPREREGQALAVLEAMAHELPVMVRTAWATRRRWAPQEWWCPSGTWPRWPRRSRAWQPTPWSGLAAARSAGSEWRRSSSRDRYLAEMGAVFAELLDR